MPTFFDQNGEPIEVPADTEAVRAALDSGFTPAPGMAIPVVRPDGQGGTVPAEKLRDALDRGYSLESEEQTKERDLELKYGDSPVRAAAEGGLRTLTFGGYDALARLAGEEEAVREIRERNTGAALAGEIGTGVGAALIGGGPAGLLKNPVSLVDDAAKAVSKKVGGGIKGAVARGSTEGALFGVGGAVSEVSLSEEPITTERIMGALGSNVLFGAGVGGLAGLGGIALEKTARKTKELSQEAIERLARRSKAPQDLVDLSKLDRKGLRAAKDAELANIEQVRASERESIVGELRSLREDSQASNWWMQAPEKSEIRKVSFSADRQLRAMLDTPKDLARYPKQALKALEKNEQALSKFLQEGAAVRAKLAKEHADILDELAKLPKTGNVTLSDRASKLYGKWADVDVGRGHMMTPAAEVARFQEALQAGKVSSHRAATLDAAEALLEKNRAIQQKIESLYQPPKSERLTAIDDAFDALSEESGKKKGLAQRLAEGAAYSAGTALAAPLGPLAPIVGAKFADMLGDIGKLTGRLASAGEKTAQRLNKAVDAFLNVTERATRSAPLAATKVLQSVSYGKAEKPLRPMVPTKSKLVEAYREREREIRAQTTMSPDGQIVMRSGARRALGERLSPIAAVSPIAADRLETLAARRLSFLAARLPKRPDVAVAMAGPDRWQPSDFEIAKFARYVAAVEDPAGILERMNDGTLTPEDAEALREVYPETFQATQRQIMERLPELQKTLPYERRLTMSILFGVPVDPAMRPEILAVLQSSFARNIGGAIAAPSNTGTPRKTPEQEPTPAQKRAG